ncbi:zinc transporter ZntB [Roseicyclus sp. F158]|uniref:Zinc transporter ZntB n=1 Tax=Tropicimonas omnivorans TaxID=3075590 RepID=A0ABU3DEM7_9RHOB|nr:zinc transporter ZntB [Roseicyclus sp. F158]MDT0682140.1 zinc transporter ZntB [Roseicyclus sp. F158]
MESPDLESAPAALPPDESTPALVAYHLARNGKGEPLGPIAPGEPPEEGGGFLWIHMFRDSPAGQGWLHGASLVPVVFNALTADETRPRCTVHDGGVILNLRGVNLNPGAEPEDMVSIRLWIQGTRVVSVVRNPLAAVLDIRDEIARGQGPVTPGDLVARLALRLADRTEPIVTHLNERIDTLEEEMLFGGTENVSRHELGDIRAMSIQMRRYMFPQRDALSTFEIEDLTWLTKADRVRLREATERVTRLGEELDAIRERAQVVQDQLMDARSEQMNHQMLVLSVVAAIFLPLGFITGLLGINVGGMPGVESPAAFWIVCLILAVTCAGQLILFRQMGLLGRRKRKRGAGPALADDPS